MPRINVLEPRVYNRISAGEVVERPSSVVKELVENALDAKSSNITIEIEEGGTKLIRISDNGCGIDFDDLPKAFMPHATSKIAKAEDLDSIATLGFRGEALASIASVAQVELVSRAEGNDIGGKICINGGVVESCDVCGARNGTMIAVKNLFYNTPARLKFLKSNRQEGSAITSIVERLMLANPNVSIKYIVDGRTVFGGSGLGLKNKIFEIYGRETTENLIPIETLSGAYKLSGYIAKPTFCKANKTYQTLIVNGRYVSNSLVSVAVSNAYENFLMKGKFPLFVLNLTLPCDEIDVNVHPSKMEIKFRESKKIYDLIYSSVLQTLGQSNSPLFFSDGTNDNVSNDDLFAIKKQSKLDDDIQPTTTKLAEVKGGFSFGDMQKLTEELSIMNVQAPNYVDKSIKVLASADYEHYNTEQNETDNFTKSKNLPNEQWNTNNKDDVIKEKSFAKKVNITQGENFAVGQEQFGDNSLCANNSDELWNTKNKSTQMEIDTGLNYKLVGRLFNTYVLIEVGDNFIMIDQHAGHERVLFDKFTAMYEEKKMISQPLMIPYVFETNEEESVLVEDNLDVFSSLGFDVENFGNKTYKISSIPALLDGINLGEFIQESLANLTKVSPTNEQIKNHFATCACKAAVKGGQNLSDGEIEILLNQIAKEGRVLQCPHGRPVYVKFSKYEIEKMFKRVVS